MTHIPTAIGRRRAAATTSRNGRRIRRRLVFLCCACACAGIARPGLAEERGPIIDVHLHTEGFTWAEGEAPRNPVTGEPSTATTSEEHLRRTVEAMDRYNVVKGIVSQSDWASVERWVDAYPDRFIGGAEFPWVNTGDPWLPDLTLLRRKLQGGRFGVIGEITAQYVGLSPSDPVFEPYWALAEELDIPVGIHTGNSRPGIVYEDAPRFRVRFGDPLLLEEMLVAHPRLRVWIMHAGGPDLVQETIALMRQYPQVYADIGILSWGMPRAYFYDYLETLMRAGLGKRIMFGSDQMRWPEAIGMAVETVEAAPFLSDEEERDIFYNNAVRFFRLDLPVGAPAGAADG